MPGTMTTGIFIKLPKNRPVQLCIKSKAQEHKQS